MIKNNKGFTITEVLILSTVIIGVLIFMYTQFKNINRSFQYSFKYDTVEGMYKANNIAKFLSGDKFDILVDHMSSPSDGYIDISNCNVDKKVVKKGDINEDGYVDSRDSSTLLGILEKLDNAEALTPQEQTIYDRSDMDNNGIIEHTDAEIIIDYYSKLSTSGATSDIVLKKPEKEYCEALLQKSNVERILFTTEDLVRIKQHLEDFDQEMVKYINQIQTINSPNDYRIIIKYKDDTYATIRFNAGIKYITFGLTTYLDGINNTGEGHSSEATTWKDLSNYNHDAVLENNPTWTNNSVIFNGTNNYGLLDATNKKIYINGVTLETRMRIKNKNQLTQEEILGNWAENNNYGGMGLIYLNTDNLYSNISLTSTWASAQDTNTSNVDEFYTVAMTFDNHIQKLYVNGTLVAQTDTEQYLPADVSSLKMTIGAKPGSTVMERCSNIEYQNILIYDRALTAAEIQRNYQIDLERY